MLREFAENLWPDRPKVFEASSAKGWTVCFASGKDGSLPAFEDLVREADTEAELVNLNGLFKHVACDGIQSLNRKVFIPFSGADRPMAEFKRKGKRGLRVLCFMLDARTILLATAFRKPSQLETPAEEKRRAGVVLAEHGAIGQSREGG